MPRRDHTVDWIFDLDNTLYPRSCRLFAQIDILITQYVAKVTGLETDAARRLQKDYYRDVGTTLNGLMQYHGVDPDHYLQTVHNIDYSSVAPNPELIELIANLPGRKFIYTNADIGHTQSVLKKLGGDDLFDGYFDIRAADYVPKPERAAYEKFVDQFDIDVSRAVMFDDLEKNLLVPHAMGMRTVQVIAEEDFAHDLVEEWELDQNHTAAHIHHRTHDLKTFLSSL